MQSPRYAYWFLAETYIKDWIRNYILGMKYADLEKGSDLVSILDTEEGCTFNFRLRMAWDHVNDEKSRFLLNIKVENMGVFKDAVLPFNANRTVSQFFAEDLYQDTFHFVSKYILARHDGMWLESTTPFKNTLQDATTKLYIACHEKEEGFCMIKCKCIASLGEPTVSLYAKRMDREDVEHCIMHYIFPELGLQFPEDETAAAIQEAIASSNTLRGVEWECSSMDGTTKKHTSAEAFRILCMHFGQQVPAFLL
jgi:hypothetical protein